MMLGGLAPELRDIERQVAGGRRDSGADGEDADYIQDRVKAVLASAGAELRTVLGSVVAHSIAHAYLIVVPGEPEWAGRP